jgi:hypothetical protein
MKKIMRWTLIILFTLCLIVWSTAGVLLTRDNDRVSDEPLPTLLELPTLTPSATWTNSPTPTATASLTPSLTPSATFTSIPSATATLTDRVLDIVSSSGEINVVASPTALPPGTILLPAPPQPIEPLPDATLQPPPYEGWYSFESDHPLVSYSSPWIARQIREASRGQYHRTDEASSLVSFPFEGEGLRVRYVAARNMGMFELIVDGEKLDTIDAYHVDLAFPGTQVYVLKPGRHLLQIRSAGAKNASSEGFAVGFDAVQIFKGSASTLILTPEPLTGFLIPTSQSVANIELVGVPATAEPTAAVERDINIELIIAYDENGNNAVDPAEGVREIPVRVVDRATNRVITESLTDATGYTTLQLQTSTSVRLVVPYFGRVWDVPLGRNSDTAQYTLLLAPGNQPGLIP